MIAETTDVEKYCEPERKTQFLDAPVCVDDKQGDVAAADVVVGDSPVAPDPKPKRQRAPRATPKKVIMEAVPVRNPVDVNDPLFFAGLNILHRRLETEARRSKLSSMPIA